MQVREFEFIFTIKMIMKEGRQLSMYLNQSAGALYSQYINVHSTVAVHLCK